MNPLLPGEGTGRRLSHRLLQIGVELVEERRRRQPGLLRADQYGEVLGHEAGLDSIDADLLEGQGEARDLGRAVELAAIVETARPREDRGDRVCRGLLALLMETVMAGHRDTLPRRPRRLSGGGRHGPLRRGARAVDARCGTGVY